ncbi:hypothetical protein LWI29_003782 [Acer saccharum]|uniref:K Homology domain-containing protein n=1 Tax=Acer saccharum TaxID=4024 RepID=A0AA39RK46_ACESA|nr:hypothetical protein LWI29_003782 [Acer saccharum]
MAEEEELVVAPDHKRKLEDLEMEAEPVAELDATAVEDGVTEADGSESKRARLDEENEKPDGSASANGIKEEKLCGAVRENAEEAIEGTTIEVTTVDVLETVEVKTDQVSSVDEHMSSDNQQISITEETKEVLISTKEETEYGSIVVKEETKEVAITEGETVEPSEKEPLQEIDNSKLDEPSTDDSLTITRRVEVPNNKVGVLIGKAGDTIRYLQYNSGAKIQITRDADADPNCMTRPVEIVGTLSNINKAEKLISAVIAEADAGGSPSLVARGLATQQAVGIGEQVEIKVPNEKVGLIIGRGGETIKGLQTRSGARIQVLIPQHLPEGDGSKERTVRVTGDMRQIEMAQEMIKEVLTQTVRPSPLSGSFNQQAYRPRGPTGPPQWGPRGPGYDYQQRGPYPPQNPQYPHPSYGGYPPQQMGPRSNFGGPPSMQGHPSSGAGGYDYYGGQGGHASDHPVSVSHSTPIPGHAPGPSPAPVGPPPSQTNYNYGQPHGPEYGHHPSYAHTGPQQSYGHGYDDGKYENHATMQNPYGGHGNPQPVYPQGSSQPGYPQPQQYGKPPPSYGMPPQVPPQSYGHPRAASQPGGDVPYQGSVPPAQSYSQPVPHQQQYNNQYASSGAMQQTYPSYGSAPATDGYNQPPPASGPGYSQQGVQSIPGYAQPAAGYGQVGPTGAYGGGYANSQQGYPEQPAPSNAGYGGHGPQEPNYASAPISAYAAVPTAQAGYAQPTQAQPTAAQPNYDQSAQQSSAYGVAPGSAPVAYGKTVSPQPGYPQYDSTQMYAAPR